MAKKMKYNQTTTKKFNIQGLLSLNGETITYLADDGTQVAFPLEKCFAPFLDQDITLSISLKTDEDLSSELDDEEEVEEA